MAPWRTRLALPLALGLLGGGCRHVLVQLDDLRGEDGRAGVQTGCFLDRARRNDPACGGTATEEVTPARLERTAQRLRRSVQYLAGTIGHRSYRHRAGLDAAQRWIHGQFDAIARAAHRSHPEWPAPEATIRGYIPGSFTPRDIRSKQPVAAACARQWNTDRRTCGAPASFQNVEMRLAGIEPEAPAIVIGAHYDADACESLGFTPGADDNASGIAVLLELAKRFAKKRVRPPLRFVAFTNEEEPFFDTDLMGSRVYAANYAQGVGAMLSLETLGYYIDAPGSQHVPWYARPILRGMDAGSFVAFIGNARSYGLTEHLLNFFRGHVAFPARGIVGHRKVPGIAWSDHASFWIHDVPAVMITDSAPNRNLCYHRDCDTPERLDYVRMARIVDGLEKAIIDLGTTFLPKQERR